MKLDPKDFTWFSTYLLAKEAESRGIKVTNPLDGLPMPQAKHHYLLLEYKGHVEVIQGQRLRTLSAPTNLICANKETTKFFFKRAGLSVAKGEVVRVQDFEKVEQAAERVGYPLVAKPIAGTHGRDVFLDITDNTRLKKIFKQMNKKSRITFLLERHCKGTEYRFFATKDRCLAVALRVPANVIGDGVHTIEQLIKEKNKDPRRGDGHTKALLKIRIDKRMKTYLKSQKLSTRTVPEEGQQVFLRRQSNLSQGGDSIDMTSEMHKDYKKLAVQAIRAIPGLPYAGVDMLVSNYKKPATKRNYTLIELNASPMFSMHHFPYEGKHREVASVLIDSIFPETKKRR